jgi:hypothetical protein
MLVCTALSLRMSMKFRPYDLAGISHLPTSQTSLEVGSVFCRIPRNSEKISAIEFRGVLWCSMYGIPNFLASLVWYIASLEWYMPV